MFHDIHIQYHIVTHIVFHVLFVAPYMRLIACPDRLVHATGIDLIVALTNRSSCYWKCWITSRYLLGTTSAIHCIVWRSACPVLACPPWVFVCPLNFGTCRYLHMTQDTWALMISDSESCNTWIQLHVYSVLLFLDMTYIFMEDCITLALDHTNGCTNGCGEFNHVFW